MRTLVVEALGPVLAGVEVAERITLAEAEGLGALGHDGVDLATVELVLPGLGLGYLFWERRSSMEGALINKFII
jgi:hypothetical protein